MGHRWRVPRSISQSGSTATRPVVFDVTSLPATHFRVSVPVDEVAPKRKTSGPTNRAVVQTRHRQALKEAMEAGKALLIDLDDGDKSLTILSRIFKAAESFGVDQVKVRRRGNRMAVYQKSRSKSAHRGIGKRNSRTGYAIWVRSTAEF
jgi:hypothetical protein